MDRVGQGLDHQGLGQAGHALEQDVAAGQEPEHEPVQHVVLADEDLAHLGLERGKATLVSSYVFGQSVGHEAASKAE